MAEIDTDQTSTELAEATPLDVILDTPAADAPAQSEGGWSDDRQVPYKAYRKEREKRQEKEHRLDEATRQLEETNRDIEEFRRKVDRYESAKLGIPSEEEQQREEQERQERWQREEQELTQDPVTRNLNRSYANFISKHGKEAEAKLDAARQRMTPEQRQHEQYLIGNHADPVTAIQAYADQLGLFDFHTPLEDALASRDKQAQPEGQFTASQVAQHYAQLNQWGQSVAAVEEKTRFLASRSDFVSEYGRDVFNQMDQAAAALLKSGHPVVAEYVQAVKASPEPVMTAAQLLIQLGVWQPQQAQQQSHQPQQAAFPSNLANRRNVGQRSGPGYAGPTPLTSIFRS